MDEEKKESSENDPLLTSQTRRSEETIGEYVSSVDSPDGLRAWIVASSILVVNFLIIGLGRVSGILYVGFMRDFNINRRLASTPFSVQQSTRNLFGPVVGILGQTFSVRALTMTGGLIASVSAAGCAFAPNIVWISILWGDFYGIATAFTSTVNQALINQYFVKNRSTASGVAFAGGSLGAMVFPFVVDHLMTDWGVEGTFFTMSALLLLIVPVAIIMKTPPWLAHQEATSETETGVSDSPHGGSPTFRSLGFSDLASKSGPQVFDKEKLIGTSASSQTDQSTNVGQKKMLGNVLNEAKHKGERILPSQLSTDSEVLPGTPYRFFEGKRKKEDVNTTDERTPLSSKSNNKDFDSKRKGLLGAIFQPIVSKAKEMFIEPSIDNGTVVLPVPKDSQIDSRIEASLNPEQITRSPNARLQEDFDYTDAIIGQDQSPAFMKRVISMIRTKVKKLRKPAGYQEKNSNIFREDIDESRQHNKQYFQEKTFQRNQNTESKSFLTPHTPPSSLHTMQTKYIESLLGNEATNTEIISERSPTTAVQPGQNTCFSNKGHEHIFIKDPLSSISEIDESSSPVSYALTISQGPLSGEAQSQRFSKENEYTEKLNLETTTGTLYSGNLPGDIDSKSNETERARMHHARIQSGTETGLQFTIHLKKQEILRNEFQRDDHDLKEVLPTTYMNPLTTLMNVQDKELDLSKDKQKKNDSELIVSTVKMDPQSGDKMEQFKPNIKDKEDTKDLVSVVPAVSTETVFSHSVPSPVYAQECLEALIETGNQKPPSIDSDSENSFRKDYAGEKTIGPVSSPDETSTTHFVHSITLPKDDGDTESKRNMADVIDESPTVEHITIEKLPLEEDNALISMSTAAVDTSISSVNTVTHSVDAEYAKAAERIGENAVLFQRTEFQCDSDPLTVYKPNLLLDKSFKDERDWYQELSTSSASLISAVDVIKQPTFDVINTVSESSEYPFQDSSNSTKNKISLEVQRVSISEESFQTHIQSVDSERKETVSITPVAHTVINIEEQSNIFGDLQNEASESDFPIQRKRDETENIMCVTGAIQKRNRVKKSQNNETSESKDKISFWPVNKKVFTMQNTTIEDTIASSGLLIPTDIGDVEETESSNFYIDFRILHENINYIIRIIQLTESLKQTNILPKSQKKRNQLSEKSEIRTDLELFLYWIEETTTVNSQSHFFTDIHSSNVPHHINNFRKEKRMFETAGKRTNSTISSENENKTYNVSFRNEYIYEILLMVFQENESIIASHFPEQDQEHILEVMLELKKLVKHCQMLESKYSNSSTISKTTTSGQQPKQRSQSKTYISLTHDNETKQSDSVDFINVGYGSIKQKKDSSNHPLYHKGETSATNAEVNTPFEKSGENLDRNENGKPNFLWGQLKIAVNLYTNPLFLLVCIGRVVHFFTFMAVLTIIVDYGIDKGLKEEEGKFLIFAMSLGDLIGRLCCGWVTDFGIVSLEIFMMISMFLQGISSISLYLVKADYLSIAAAVFSVLQGAVFVRHPVLVCKYTERHEQFIALGFINLSAGILGFGMPNYIGYFRDGLGSYNLLLCINGGMCIAVGLMWTFVPCYFRLSPTQPEASV